MDEAVQREILFKQARVCEVHLEDISGATTTYETILDTDPENTDALEALERLYEKAERWADLMELLERRTGFDETLRVDLSASGRRILVCFWDRHLHEIPGAAWGQEQPGVRA